MYFANGHYYLHFSSVRLVKMLLVQLCMQTNYEVIVQNYDVTN